MPAEEEEKLDRFLSFLDDTGIGKVLEERHQKAKPLGGRPDYDPCHMFAAVLLGFAYTSGSLRDIADACIYDMRFQYVLEGDRPGYRTFGSFINDYILPDRNRFLPLFTGKFFEKAGISSGLCFLDGTKVEADCNRYKFVWKPVTWHRRKDETIRGILLHFGLDTSDKKGFLTSDYVFETIAKLRKRQDKMVKKDRELVDKLEEFNLKVVEYEIKEAICGPSRKSYYKTDHDATAMCLKDDYYAGLGSSMHTAYNIQEVVSHGMILDCYVSQDRADYHAMIPCLEKFREDYGKLPQRICADAGYGSEDNYAYLDANGVEAFVKYQEWEGEVSGRRPPVYQVSEDGNSIICLNGKTGLPVEIPDRHPKSPHSRFFEVKDCAGCPFMPYCHRYMKEKVTPTKVFEVNAVWKKYKQKARDRLLSPEGIETRVNRSIQVEGAFGIMKQDMGYDRFRRISLAKVSAEYILTALGFDTRKLMRFLRTGKMPRFWKAPEGLEAERVKKPSAKRLNKRAAKIRTKSVNEIAKKR